MIAAAGGVLAAVGLAVWGRGGAGATGIVAGLAAAAAVFALARRRLDGFTGDVQFPRLEEALAVTQT